MGRTDWQTLSFVSWRDEEMVRRTLLLRVFFHWFIGSSHAPFFFFLASVMSPSIDPPIFCFLAKREKNFECWYCVGWKGVGADLSGLSGNRGFQSEAAYAVAHSSSAPCLRHDLLGWSANYPFTKGNLKQTSKNCKSSCGTCAMKKHLKVTILWLCLYNNYCQTDRVFEIAQKLYLSTNKISNKNGCVNLLASQWSYTS